jgi:hypothetical protein
MPAPDEQQAWYLPFWRVRADVKGFDAPLYVDPLKYGSANRGLRRPIFFPHFSFWIPAFTVNPMLFLRLCERATVWQPAGDLATNPERTDDRHVHPVTLPAVEAERLLLIILSLIIAEKERTLPSLVSAKIVAAERALVFVPFLKLGSEVVNGEMRATIQLNALEHGRSL